MKNFIKKYGTKLGIGTIIFLLLGFGLFILGAYLADWDIWGWFTTSQAYLVYAVIVIFTLVSCSLIFVSKILSDTNGDE